MCRGGWLVSPVRCTGSLLWPNCGTVALRRICKVISYTTPFFLFPQQIYSWFIVHNTQLHSCSVCHRLNYSFQVAPVKPSFPQKEKMNLKESNNLQLLTLTGNTVESLCEVNMEKDLIFCQNVNFIFSA